MNCDNPRHKRHKWYLFCRVYALVVVAAHEGLVVASRWERVLLLYAVFAIPLFIPAFLMLLNLAPFPFQYSVFGAYKRTPFPNEKPILLHETVRGLVGFMWVCSMLSYAWTVYPSGLGIRIPWCGKVFILFEHFRNLRTGGIISRVLFGHKLTHDSPEVRNPIGTPSTRVVKEIQRFLSNKRGTSEQGANGL